MKNLRIMGSGKLRVLNHILVNYPKFDLYEHSIILGYRGSTVHGTYIADKQIIDDIDIMGVAIPPINYYMGLNKFEQFERLPEKEDKTDPWDIVIYEFHKFVRLLIKSNPNVMQLLWLPERFYINVSDIGKELIANRHLFATKHAYHSFSGYAYGQLKRMTADRTNWRMGAKRKLLVEKHGYDVKNAAHLIRLLRMGIEFLKEGELYPVRKDASQLIQIKRGEWKLEKVKKTAERLFEKCETAYIKSKLPDKPDETKIKELTYELTKQFLIKN